MSSITTMDTSIKTLITMLQSVQADLLHRADDDYGTQFVDDTIEDMTKLQEENAKLKAEVKILKGDCESFYGVDIVETMNDYVKLKAEVKELKEENYDQMGVIFGRME